ncbi:hypothetical protein FHR90_002392 [Endobacter medicaginis]|uniref:Uncharacterized protein n=1 Tax=Endobacter medicaginis TaxID=1181271 RepID=A0A850NP98_9PROT|nr:hypothetical protein [Endobacter medicaginis]MBB3174547.1 hypothetical protein [Endobacter medicaginis]MCX5474760.1 hypothetical protein [Endobacter medicaginis]NVN29182.1 hypothetical protein [Endobacter medicaginis]
MTTMNTTSRPAALDLQLLGFFDPDISDALSSAVRKLENLQAGHGLVGGELILDRSEWMALSDILDSEDGAVCLRTFGNDVVFYNENSDEGGLAHHLN